MVQECPQKIIGILLELGWTCLRCFQDSNSWQKYFKHLFEYFKNFLVLFHVFSADKQGDRYFDE